MSAYPGEYDVDVQTGLDWKEANEMGCVSFLVLRISNPFIPH